jgi:putative hydrolases of HD superfamily
VSIVKRGKTPGIGEAQGCLLSRERPGIHVETIDRVQDQLRFLNEIEKLKGVYRRNRTLDQGRFENSAEHSWHVTLMALVLSEYANNQPIDLFKVVKMLLIHDLVEIYAGDTWVYDAVGSATQADREAQAATKLFSLLPADQGAALHTLWKEFETRTTAEAVYAVAIDALQPLTNHLLTSDGMVEEPMPTQRDVIHRKRHIELGSTMLWEVAQTIIATSTAKGLYRDDTVDT